MAAAVIRGHHENGVARVGRTDQFAFQISIERISPQGARVQVALPISRSAYRRRSVGHDGPAVPLSLRQVDPLIRQLTIYRDLIDRKTGDSR